RGNRSRSGDTGRSRRLPGRVHHEQLVARDQSELHQREQEEHDRGQYKRELDRGLSVVGTRAEARLPTTRTAQTTQTTEKSAQVIHCKTLPMTPLKIDPMPFDLVIQLRSRPTIAAAATMTSAYSAVDWPSSWRTKT